MNNNLCTKCTARTFNLFYRINGIPIHVGKVCKICKNYVITNDKYGLIDSFE